MNPGDTWQGQGVLLQQGRRIATVDYHLTIPTQTHFTINPTGRLRFNYEDYLGGFILLTPKDAETLELADYTLELADKSKKQIRVAHRYKRITHKGQERVSFWVQLQPKDL